MSHLTTECKVCYVAVLYSKHGDKIDEGSEYFMQESAIEDAKERIANHVDRYGTYCYADIICRVMTVYS